MTPINYPAVRALRHVLERNEELKSLHTAWQCDRHFDAGEWSDRFHSDLFQRAEERITAAVAARFGMTEVQLTTDSMGAGYEEMEREQRARQFAADVARMVQDLDLDTACARMVRIVCKNRLAF